MRTIHHHLCTVIPPHILRHVAEHGDARERQTIESTVAQMEELREGRTETFLKGPPPSPPQPLKKQRNVYDAAHRQTLPGKLLLSEKKTTTSDLEAREAFDGSGATFDFYSNIFNRNSIDDRGKRIDSSVHYGSGFDNAMWNGRQMIYGDGDGKLFNRFTASLDVIGHELTHGVTQYTAGLGYRGENGALNEHISDAFGVMVKQYALGQTAGEADWLIGAGILSPRINGVAVRSMAAPGTAYDDPLIGRDPQPAHMRNYVRTLDDNGGVHINSGIPNHAFYLAAMAAGVETWKVVGRIWFATLTRKLAPSAQFNEFATATVITAGELYGTGSHEQQIVKDAWSAVGLAASGLVATPRLPIKATAAPRDEAAAVRARASKWRSRAGVRSPR